MALTGRSQGSVSEQLRDVEEAHAAGLIDATTCLEGIRRHIAAAERKVFPKCPR